MNTFFTCGNLTDAIAASTKDIHSILLESKFSLDAQLRAYDLLESLLAEKENGSDCFKNEEFKAAAECFCREYEDSAEMIDRLFDEDTLKKEAADRTEALEKIFEEARFKAAAAASLHEFAKETFEIWQTSGIFARKRALKALRERAGFRLESHRIGNYVAKTYDLMEEARRDFQKARQKLFAANIAYKIRKSTFPDIARLLTTSDTPV